VSERHPAKSSAVDRVKALPWTAMLQVSLVLGRRWRSLSDKDRDRFTRLVRDSRGRASNLSTKERAELRRLVGKLDVKRTGRELAFVVGRAHRRDRRRRKHKHGR
jgi:hypothetical protein